MNTLCGDQSESLIREIQASMHAKVLQFTGEQLIQLLPAATSADFGTWLCGECPQVRQLPKSDVERICTGFRQLLRARLSIVPIPHQWLAVA